MRAYVQGAILFFFLIMGDARAQTSAGLGSYVRVFTPSNAHALCTAAMTTSLRKWGFSQIKQHDLNLVFGRRPGDRAGAYHASCYCWSPAGLVVVTVYGPDISAASHIAERMANEIAGQD